MRAVSFFSLALAAIWCGPAVAQYVYWVPAAAHVSGIGDTAWRTDLAMANAGVETAAVEIRLHRSSATDTLAVSIPAGHHLVLADAVLRITGTDASGSLEILSSEPLTVRSRTYNAAPGGTFGQALDGITAVSGLTGPGAALLLQLAENASFRTNIGAVNIGDEPATVRVELFDATGTAVGTFWLDLPPGRLRQDTRPYRARFGRTDITGGSARISLDQGGPVYAYASVIDARTGDPTTVPMKPERPCR